MSLPHRPPCRPSDRLPNHVRCNRANWYEPSRPLPMVRPMRFLVMVGALLIVGCTVSGPPSPSAPNSTPTPIVTSSTPSPAPTPIVTPTSLPSPTDTPTPTPSPRATADTTVVDVPVIARVDLAIEDVQTPWENERAVIGTTIWLVVDGRRLVSIDAVTHRVMTRTRVREVELVAGDGRLWTIGPIGVAGGSSRPTLSEVNLETGKLTSTGYPEVWTAGLQSLWGIGRRDGLFQLDATNGELIGNWPTIQGLAHQLEFACGMLWIEGWDQEMDTLTPFDPVNEALGAVIDETKGIDPPHQTADGCWAILGSPGPSLAPGLLPADTGYFVHLDMTGIIEHSPLTSNRLHIAGDTFWESTTEGLIWQVDRATGEQVGHRWQLPREGLPTVVKSIDWELISVGGDLWLLNRDTLTHFDISTES
jgi:hypothetical protein